MKIPRLLLATSLLCAMGAGFALPAWAATDPFPKACVSCHVLDKAKGTDHRLSTALAQWSAGKVGPGLLAKSKAASPAGLVLKGKHPSAEDSLEDVPAACLDCHGPDSKKAPPFSRLMHLVHLTGTNNAYVANFKGDCANCHKLNAQTGEWSLPGGAEQ